MTALRDAWGDFQGVETWSEFNNCSEWAGVTCEGSDSVVTAIQLAGTGITGSIPDEIGNLTDLHTLNLRNNSLSGRLPDSLGFLSNLTILYVSENQMSGAMPETFGLLVSLQELHMSYNAFVGPLPGELGNLQSLTLLVLHNNQFAGRIPPQFGKLIHLLHLDLSHNHFNGIIPRGLGLIRGLSYMDLSANQLEGEFPPSFAHATSLAALHLRYNRITGRLPAFPRLRLPSRGLVVIDLGRNFFRGPPVMNIGGKAVCLHSLRNPHLRVLVDSTCLTATSRLCPLPRHTTRPGGQCSYFCGTGTPAGQCNGKGVCFIGSRGPVCHCGRGYKQLAGHPKACVRA